MDKAIAAHFIRSLGEHTSHTGLTARIEWRAQNRIPELSTASHCPSL